MPIFSKPVFPPATNSRHTGSIEGKVIYRADAEHPWLVAVPASAAAMWLAGILGKTETPTMIEAVERLHSNI